METFPRAFCLYAAAGETKERKYDKAASLERSTLQKWVKKGGVNFVHQLHILDGKDAALKGQETKAKQLYEKAIVTAARGGFLQDAGLANERYALFLLSRNAVIDASHHMKEALRYYSECGASHKVEQLKEKFSH